MGRLPARIIPFEEDFNFIKDKEDNENLKNIAILSLKVQYSKKML